MKKVLIICLILFSIGCSKKEEKVEKIEMNCNDIISKFNITTKNSIVCHMDSTKYSFRVKKIKADSITISDEKDEYILTKEKELVIEKNNKNIILKWN